MNIFDTEISIFPNYHSPDTGKVITLAQWFASKKYSAKVIELRKCQDKKLRDDMKATLPAITPSGKFSKRQKDCLIQHSGFIQFDIDASDNPNMEPETWKPEIMKLGCAMCQLSVSGKGLWGLVRIENPAKHEQHFHALSEVFKYWGITIDGSCKDVSRLRGYSYDPGTLFNYEAQVFTGLKEKRTRHHVTAYTGKQNDISKFEYCLKLIDEQGIDITEGYQNWFSIGCSIAAEFGEQGRGYFHKVSKHYPKYDLQETDKQYDACLKGTGHSIASFFWFCDQHNIVYSEKKSYSVDNEIACRMINKNPALKDLIFDTAYGWVSNQDHKEFSCN